MDDNTKFSAWTSVINSVKTPLGFFALLALILDAILLGGAALTTRVPMLAPVILLGILIACVFAIVLIKPYALYHPKDWPMREKRMTVKLIFPIEPIEVDLDAEKCILEIRDEEGHKKPQVTPNLTLGHGGWSFQLPDDVLDTDSVRLELVEYNEGKWKVRPFPPFETTVEVLKIN